MMKTERPKQAEDPYILQRLALVTYKSKYPTEEKSLFEGREILQTLNPQTTNDPETLGLWGSVHKRLWQLTKTISFLDEAIRAYERGFNLRNDYYKGASFAFLLNVRADNTDDPADAIADFVEARRARKEVLSICEIWIASHPGPSALGARGAAFMEYRSRRYWVLAVMAEAYLGLGEEAQSQRRLEEAFADAPADWMIATTQEAIENLKIMLRNSPLKYLKTKVAE
jgi:hypothetical protein